MNAVIDVTKLTEEQQIALFHDLLKANPSLKDKLPAKSKNMEN